MSTPINRTMGLRVKKCSGLVPAIEIYRTPDASKSQLSTFVPNHTLTIGTSVQMCNT